MNAKVQFGGFQQWLWHFRPIISLFECHKHPGLLRRHLLSTSYRHSGGQGLSRQLRWLTIRGHRRGFDQCIFTLILLQLIKPVRVVILGARRTAGDKGLHDQEKQIFRWWLTVFDSELQLYGELFAKPTESNYFKGRYGLKSDLWDTNNKLTLNMTVIGGCSNQARSSAIGLLSYSDLGS